MAWTVRFDRRAEREIRGLDRPVQIRIVRFLRDRVAALDDPRQIGEALKGPLRSFWKYRVGDYRVVADLRERELVILVVRIGHRRTIYR